MTVIVGHLAGKGGLSALHLAVGAARTLDTSLTVATIVPRPWLTPSLARVDSEYAHWADQLAADSADEAHRYLGALADGIEVEYLKHVHRSVSGGLTEVVEQTDADVLVLGSSPNGQLGQVVIGSTTDRMLHSAPVPVAISPRGYRGSGALTRISCAYPGTPEAIPVVRRVVAWAGRLAVPMRVLTFAIRGRTMYPPEVGLHAEDSILAALASDAGTALARLRSDGIVDDSVALEVVTGNGWDQALDAADWEDGEILALGTSPRGDIARVFLGSHGAKIVRHSPVPVLVLPG